MKTFLATIGFSLLAQAQTPKTKDATDSDGIRSNYHYKMATPSSWIPMRKCLSQLQKRSH